jgi:hypothetical protein
VSASLSWHVCGQALALRTGFHCCDPMRLNQVWNEVVGDDVAADIRSALKALKVRLLAVIGLLVWVACGATCHPAQRTAPLYEQSLRCSG